MDFAAPRFDMGVTIGRFGHVQLGHNSLFDMSMSLCRRTYIIVGSAQERDTLRNPFTVETRIKAIRECYPGVPESKLIIGGLNDMTNELDINTEWGRYLKSHIIAKMHKFASLMVYGNDEFRSQWFSAEDLKHTAEIVIPRSTIPISGTQVRGLLLIDDEAAWQKCTNEMIHFMYPELREELMSVPVYKEIYDIVRRGEMDLDSFMKVYKQYEEEDRQKKLAELQK